jgi:sulfoxide reductase heme-binding subunit YedZ
MHLTSSPIDWYAARAAGIAAYVMLTAVICLGLSLSARAPGRRWRGWPMFAVEDVHRYGGLLVGTFIAIHVVTIALDSFLPFTLTQLLVPLASSYRPLWTGLGIAAAELLIALAVTNHYRRRVPFRWWRGAHYANFAVWAAATLHGLGSGTDRNAAWMLAIYIVSVTLVVSLLLWRIAERRNLPSPLTGPRVVGITVAAALVVLGLALGPLRLHSRAWNADTFHDRLTGRILQQSGGSTALVSMTGVGRGDQSVLVRADLLVSSNSLRATTFQMEYLPSGELCTGTVSHVQSYGFSGTCRTAEGSRLVDASWHLSNGGSLSGRLDARSGAVATEHEG